ncbi:MAG: hypothetical protein QM539_06380 [Alphaproteobacteria bacterium]|nr:hypothetical protein [Alphaproteobacteria bacterium]
MKQVSIFVDDEKVNQFIELVNNITYIKKFIVVDTNSCLNENIDNIKQGFKELNLIKKGKLKSKSVKDFLNEISS